MSRRDRGSMLPHLSFNHLCWGGVGKLWPLTIWEVISDGSWYRLNVLSEELFVCLFVLVQNISKQISWIGRRGFMVSDGCHRRHTCLLTPLRWCMVLLHSVAGLQHSVRQAKAAPDSSAWTVRLYSEFKTACYYIFQVTLQNLRRINICF